MGILIHTLLLVFMTFNFVRYVLNLKQKPYSIMVFYAFSLVTLISLICSYAVIRDPKGPMLIVEFSALFVAEWGIQIIGASQATCAIELVLLMKMLSITDLEGDSRVKFLKYRLWLRIGLTVLAVVIVFVPISFIIRSTVIFNNCLRRYDCLL